MYFLDKNKMGLYVSGKIFIFYFKVDYDKRHIRKNYPTLIDYNA